jgi:hypothetical protein
MTGSHTARSFLWLTRVASAGAVVCALMRVTMASLFAAAMTSKMFDVQADVAEVTLKKFAVQSGIEVVFASSTVGKVRTNAVKGEFLPREALSHMVANTPLTVAVDEKTGTLVVHRTGPARKTEPSRREHSAKKKP